MVRGCSEGFGSLRETYGQVETGNLAAAAMLMGEVLSFCALVRPVANLRMFVCGKRSPLSASYEFPRGNVPFIWSKPEFASAIVPSLSDESDARVSRGITCGRRSCCPIGTAGCHPIGAQVIARNVHSSTCNTRITSIRENVRCTEVMLGVRTSACRSLWSTHFEVLNSCYRTKTGSQARYPAKHIVGPRITLVLR